MLPILPTGDIGGFVVFISPITMETPYQNQIRAFHINPDSYEKTLETIKSQPNLGIVIKFPDTKIIPLLDDLPLNPFEFRVMYRIVRHGECSESVKDIAKAIRVDQGIVCETLHRLTDRGFIEKIDRLGKPDAYRSLITY